MPLDRMRDAGSGLLTDLYQLTMLDAYLAADMHQTAVFEFFVRRMPGNRNFLVFAGLEQLLQFLDRLRFHDDEIAWLESTGRFTQDLLEYLADFRFSGEVRAMREGTVFFANEPVVQIIAPLPEAQLVETRLINLIHFQTLIASKAARCVLAAPGRQLVDFGLRRAHGAEAGLLAARASYLAGFAGTSTVLAEAEFGIPAFGTMAHSFVQAHDKESEAFEHFARMYPEGSVLLIDTYDTLEAAHKVTELVSRLRPEGIRVRGVRLDSGDLAALATEVRRILDDGGCDDVSIFCSGSVDEYLLARDFPGVPADGFGIGTRLDVSADAPYLDCAYKIQEYAGVPRRKKSAGKATWPGRKQVFRRYRDDGIMDGDRLAGADEDCRGSALLDGVMSAGRSIGSGHDLVAAREYAAIQLAALPEALRDPLGKGTYRVEVSQRLRDLAERMDRMRH
jgi:nicotinate phosphoribosyltransferase